MSFGFTSMVHEVNRPNTSPCSQWVHVLLGRCPPLSERRLLWGLGERVWRKRS